MSRRRVAVVPHTHWDREWYSPFQTFRLRLVDLLDELLPSLEADLGYSHFLLDGQMAVVDDYVAVRPEAKARLRHLVGSGRVAVGPWYTLPDEFCVSGETLVRNLQMGMARADEFGGAMDVGYLPDMFGHVAQMPQLLRLLGLDRAVVWRGVPAAVDRTSFWWSAPDGSEVRAEYLWHGYGNGAAIPDDAKALVTRINAALEDIGPALAGDLLFMNGTDHQRPQPWLGRVVAEANAIQDELELVVTSLDEALSHSAATLGGAAVDLPRWYGELRSGARANLLMGVASNRLDVRQAAARAERALERRAEPLCALWMPTWPAALLDEAWLLMARNAAHDSSCACSADEVGTAVLHRYAEASQIADGLAERALRCLAATLAQAGAIVVNPSARTRGGLVEVVVPGEGPIDGGQLLENHPTVHTDRVMDEGETWSWMLWFRSQRIDDSTYVNRVDVEDGVDAVELTLHCDERLLDNLLVDDVKGDVRARMARRPGVPLHLRILQPPTRRVLWRMENVTGFGWRRWDATPSEQVPVTAIGSVALTNGLVTLTVDPDDGTFSIGDVTGLGRIVESGDHGDTYNYSPPDEDLLVTRPEGVVVDVVERGPLRGRLRVLSTFSWPERIDDNLRRRVGQVAVQLTTTLELRAGESFVRVVHAWDNRCRDHRVRAVLPLPSPAERSQAECAFAVVTRGLHAEGGRTERALATSFSRRFVSAGGLTAVHDGLLEYELTDADGNSVSDDASSATALSLTLVRATGMLSRVEMTNRPLPAGPPLPLEGPQLQGPIRVSYAVSVANGVDPYGLADDVLMPLAVAVAPGGGAVDADDGRALDVRGVEVSAVLREAGGLVVRIVNPSEDPVTARLPNRSGWVVNLRGRVLEAFDGEVALRPWEIATLRLR